MFHICHSLFSPSLHRVCVSPALDRQRHATLHLAPLPRCLSALSPPESANDRCSLHHRNLLQSGETYLPKPRWLFRIADLAGAGLCSQPGVRSPLLLSLSLRLSHSEAKHFSFFPTKPSDPAAVDCISAIPPPETHRKADTIPRSLYTPHCALHPVFLYQ